MSWQTTPLATPTLFAVVITLFLAGYALRQLKNGQREPIIFLFFWMSVATAVWTGFSALKLLHTDPETKLLFYRLLHIGAATLPPLIFLFVAAYTDRTRWFQPVFIGGIFFLPVVFIGLLFLNPAGLVIRGIELSTNGLVILRVNGGPAFLLFSAYSSVLIVATFLVLLSETLQVGKTYYPQASLLGIAIFTPMMFSILTTASVPPFTADGINLVPTSAAISTTATGILLKRYRLFDVPQLAYTTAMKYSPDGVFVFDRDERIIHANDRGHELLDQMGVQFGDVLTHEFPDFDPATASEELFEIPTKDGDPAYKRLFVESLNRGERDVGWVVVFRDETTQHRQQQRLEQQNEQLEAFASVVSHDLRNPLNIAQGQLQLAMETGELEHLDPVENAHQRMESLIEDLLLLAKSGVAIDEVESVRLDDVTRDSWEVIESNEARLEVVFDAPLMIQADRSRVRQLLENLFRNAIEHGGQDVTITVGNLSDDVGFFVEDNGVGIPAGHGTAVFDRGFSTQDRGTGFGLTIVAEIVKAHGWKIAVKESSTGGARFEISDIECEA